VPDTNRVLINVADGVAELVLNRPEKRNALDDALFVALSGATRALIDDRSVRAVVVAGSGGAFCAGLDFASFASFAKESDGGERPFGDPGRRGSGRRNPGTGWGIVQNLRAIPVPVIAAVDGAAVGGGLQLALGCDIRIAGRAAKFAAKEIDFGITLDMGGTQLLPRLVGYDRAMELITSGRIVEPDEAFRLGLVTTVVDSAIDAARRLAAEVASRNPEAVAATKSLLRLAGRSTPEEAVRVELEMLAWNVGRANQREATRAFFEKRAPIFEDVDPDDLPPPMRRTDLSTDF
jgi:enoyl-CoA hydratase/carnithine racemase